MEFDPAGVLVSMLLLTCFCMHIEGEADIAGGSYDLTFDNPISEIGPINFVWGRASYSVQ